ncbi:hypothetical protein N7509_006409 [Penicillium cosmopolitanum]|uniref:Alpha/beta hydrolase fold-3 domain-containing protein n=1 Tax=Penicillium cosmopolitanum TaxID=1131564 RepID=A0A9X0BAX7_9EURO|nr:uncharacterized protein N7509_006409 [Penicillium cosmopolitanum]KAJ5398296.1 hypothetical protein N7509_006409 [Penicillium cosmopolitanum]
MAEPQTATYTYKVVGGLSLTIDISRPRNLRETGIVLIHFHGGFLVIGEKTTFPPDWLINACQARGWTYATASYRLMPEATGLEILSDTLDAVRWVHQNISDRIIIAGSSAGGYLALATGAHPECPRPLSILSIYGMLDPASKRYIDSGVPLRVPVSNLETALEEIGTVANSGQSIDGYAFPKEPPIDQRFRWIGAIHEAARYPDLLTRIPGLAGQIREVGVSAIPVYFRGLFPVSFRLSSEFPPTVLLHGDSDELVDFEQSALVADKMKSLGIDVHLERAVGQGHGFEVKTSINLDAMEMEGEDAAMKAGLRRVIMALEAAVSKVNL